MDRRSFIKTALASFGAFTMDPERLLWVPGAKTIFLPPEKKVETYDLDDMSSLLTLNQKVFACLYGSRVAEAVIADSRRSKRDPFSLYFEDLRSWRKKELQ